MFFVNSSTEAFVHRMLQTCLIDGSWAVARTPERERRRESLRRTSERAQLHPYVGIQWPPCSKLRCQQCRGEFPSRSPRFEPSPVDDLQRGSQQARLAPRTPPPSAPSLRVPLA